MKRKGKMAASQVSAPTGTRCAIYTRKSTEEGLEQEFNTLDAQREAGENYIRSQASEGWTILPDRYDDGGFTGGNMDRPALKRLMADIAAGKVDVVVVYKVDRLSRSLLDFAQMMQVFESAKVSFVSVTQQFHTATSMGRLVLNVLLSFAQFEREIISERTRDKIAATRRKGKWAGGWPILGYDVDPHGRKLLVNAVEAERVRVIFHLYLEHESLMPVVQELAERGWMNKEWQTRKSAMRGGKRFCKTSLHKLLTNVTYTGKVRYKDAIYEGEHKGIVDPTIWQQVQAMLERNGRSGGTPSQNKFGAILKGLIRCVPCGCAMTPTHTTRDGGKRRYRYYVCSSAQKMGWRTCPSKAIPAGQIEELVVKQIKMIGHDPTVLREIVTEAHRQDEARVFELEAEQRGLKGDLKNWHSEMRKLSGEIQPHGDNQSTVTRLAELQERITTVEERLRTIQEQLHAVRNQTLDASEALLAVSAFDLVWGSLSPQEQWRVVQLLVEQVDYDGSQGKVGIIFRPAGIKTLAEEWAEKRGAK
ncbi:MAG: recombinase family protein [Bacteroidales bacterium]|nr:recombinase family protein [Bacteroidales bacterium]